MSQTFPGFPAAGLRFLSNLGKKDKPWFDARRKEYQANVVGPTKAFVTALGERLAEEFGSGVMAVPKTNGSISPINNDVRFSPDKSPYKDHLLLRFWDGPDKKTAPTLFVRVSEASVGFATGAAIPSADRWRVLIDDPASGASLSAAVAALADGRDVDIAGRHYKRVPAPYAEDHPRADLLRHKSGIQVRWPKPTEPIVHTPDFVDYCFEELKAAGPVHRWFVEHL